MAIAVKEVPWNTREYMFPSSPMTVAPMKETMSERLKICASMALSVGGQN